MVNKMTIYEIGTGYTPIPAKIGAATEIVAAELAKAFQAKGHNVKVVDVEAENRDPFPVPIHEVPMPHCLRCTDLALGLLHKAKRVAYSLCLARELRHILKECPEGAILHFHNQYNLFFFLLLTPARLRKRAFIAYTVHSGIWRQPWEVCAKTIRTRYFQESYAMKKADLVFVLNPETKENAQNHLHIPLHRLVQTANGVDTQIYRPLGEKTAGLGMEGERLILQVGSVCENKGQLRSLELLAPAMERNKNLHFAFAGGIVSQPYYEELIARTKEMGLTEQVRYLGMIPPGPQLNRVYNMAEATIFSSCFEAFGMAMAESLACGVPVLIPEGADYSLGAGCIPCSAETMEARLEDIQKNKAVISAAARENALAHFTWERIAAEHLKCWEERMKSHG